MSKKNIFAAAILGLSFYFLASAEAGFHSLTPFVGARLGKPYAGIILGLHYDYRSIPFMGFEAIFEKTLSKPDPITQYGLGVALYPIPLSGLKLIAIPGIFNIANNNFGFLRLGGSYNMGFGPIMAGPLVYADLIKDHGTSYIAGLMFGIKI